jgi:GAF domain-containing protein
MASTPKKPQPIQRPGSRSKSTPAARVGPTQTAKPHRGGSAKTAEPSAARRAPTLAIRAPSTRDVLAQRETELALVNLVQGGLARKLDFKAIVDLVGDKLREVLRTPDLIITWLDEQANLIYPLYVYEHGRRLTIPPQAPRPGGMYEKMRKTRAPIVLAAAADYAGLTAPVPGTDQSKSMICVPIFVGDRLAGDISIENFEREDAFGPEDVRVLTTVAASLGVALDNAHLFDETQRLLKETEQRNAELAVINSIQEGVAAELDFRMIIELVVDKLREVL